MHRRTSSSVGLLSFQFTERPIVRPRKTFKPIPSSYFLQSSFTISIVKIESRPILNPMSFR